MILVHCLRMIFLHVPFVVIGQRFFNLIELYRDGKSNVLQGSMAAVA